MTVPLVAPSDLTAADGVIFGVPTRFGQNPAQVKALLDSTGQLWAKGALLGRQHIPRLQHAYDVIVL